MPQDDTYEAVTAVLKADLHSYATAAWGLYKINKINTQCGCLLPVVYLSSQQTILLISPNYIPVLSTIYIYIYKRLTVFLIVLLNTVLHYTYLI